MQRQEGQGAIGSVAGNPVLPPLACDCHAHVFGPHAHYPMSANRAYSPGEALFSEYGRVLRGLGIGRAVLVQPSIYGFDNSCQLEATTKLRIDARAVVALDSSADMPTVERLHGRGARGVRTNLLVGDGLGWSELLVLADLITPFGWHLDVQLDCRMLAAKEDDISQLPLPVVLDHLANWRPTASKQDTDALLRVLELENVWIKLSSIHRLSVSGPPYDDIADIARKVIAVAPCRVLWGSDWPYPIYRGPPVDVRLVLSSVIDWCGDERARQRIFVDNPNRLFGFEASTPPALKPT